MSSPLAPTPADWEVVIVGAGPAGLSCALLLGRCRRRVLVCSQGPTRNARSRAVHGLLSRDGTSPGEIISAARADLAGYPDVSLREGRVVSLSCRDGRQVAHLADGSQVTGLVLVLATGLIDQLPDIPGLDDGYGISVHHCPYCDAYEVRDRPLAVIGAGASALGLALSLTRWSRDIVLYLLDDPSQLSQEQHAQLRSSGVQLERRPIQRVACQQGQVEHVILSDGSQRPCAAIFVTTSCQPGFSEIARVCQSSPEEPTVPTEKYGATSTPGIYVIGDAARDAQLVVVAAAEGAGAAVAINKALTTQDLARERQDLAPPVD